MCDVSTHRAQQRRGRTRVTKGAHMNLLWIILIVVLVLALLGFVGRGRF
jgi:flagellar basal body-associated protein FliL